MNNFRYVIEWQKVMYDEVSPDKWGKVAISDVFREIYADECKFNERVSELESYEEIDVNILGLYTCELQRITSR